MVLRFPLANPVSVAPMMERTDRHFRYLLRLISRRALLYTEMITSSALLHGDRERFLGFHPSEHPIAVQLGGSDPRELADAAQIAETYRYDEINLNIGCPSARVQKGRIGACLMADPERVAECVDAIRGAVSLPVSVKTRIGINNQDSYEFLASFVDVVARSGCQKFVIHARKALLDGPSPKKNRTVPALRYDRVFRLKSDFPALEIVLNGGIENLDRIGGYLERVDGVMIGRAVYKNPYLFSAVDCQFYGESRPIPTRVEILQGYVPYIREQFEQGTCLLSMTRHLFGLFHACPFSRQWRRRLSELAVGKPRDGESVIAALSNLAVWS
ncbi:MAG: tRNA dihydrouridine(20/20a) synthase DusA [Gammaproteobacteria bacterium]